MPNGQIFGAVAVDSAHKALKVDFHDTNNPNSSSSIPMLRVIIPPQHLQLSVIDALLSQISRECGLPTLAAAKPNYKQKQKHMKEEKEGNENNENNEENEEKIRKVRSPNDERESQPSLDSWFKAQTQMQTQTVRQQEQQGKQEQQEMHRKRLATAAAMLYSKIVTRLHLPTIRSAGRKKVET
jgi:hypothetical protein